MLDVHVDVKSNDGFSANGFFLAHVLLRSPGENAASEIYKLILTSGMQVVHPLVIPPVRPIGSSKDH